jgi:hypothetical protein
MAGSAGVGEDDIYTFLRTAGTAQRAARYPQEAERLLEIARAEKTGAFRETLQTVPKQYDQLAEALPEIWR